MESAERLKKIPPYLFMELRQKIGKARAAGIDVISLAIGDPVEPTPEPVIDELGAGGARSGQPPVPDRRREGHARLPRGRGPLVRAALRRDGRPADRGARRSSARRRAATTSCWRGSTRATSVLMTDPGYPGLSRQHPDRRRRAGERRPSGPSTATCPALRDIPSDVAQARHGDVPQLPEQPDRRRRDTAVPARAGRVRAQSTTSPSATTIPTSRSSSTARSRSASSPSEGAKDVGVELNSLSKPFNMTGWRIGMALGNPDLIAAISKVKENTDSGVFNAIQYAGIAAFTRCAGHDSAHAADLRAPPRPGRRHAAPDRHRVHAGAAARSTSGCRRRAACRASSSPTCCSRRRSVVVAPGRGYGEYGEGFFRISLTVPDARLEEAMERIRQAARA